MAEISAKQAKQLQDNVNAKREGTLFPGMDLKKEVKVEANQYSDILTLLRIRFKEGKAIFLKGNIPSLKSSQEIMQMNTGKSMCCNAEYIKNAVKDYTCTKCHNKCQLGKKPILRHSSRVQEYIDSNSQQYIDNRPLFLELIKDQQKPIYIGIYFIRESQHRWDFHNAIQLVADTMSKHGLIPDDDVSNLIPVYLGSHHDKGHAGGIMIILNTINYQNYLLSSI